VYAFRQTVRMEKRIPQPFRRGGPTLQPWFVAKGDGWRKNGYGRALVTRSGRTLRAGLCGVLLAALAPRAVFTQVFLRSAPGGDIDEVLVKSPALDGNLLGDSPTRHVSIYLPPSYGKGPSHYPSLYLLHGYLGSDRSWTDGERIDIQKIADRLMLGGKMREMIIVMPDASNRYLGSMYTDSATTGKWEEFITQDLVRYVDRRYRTSTKAESRGIAGHDMGGYGALKLAMKHPDVFSAVYAMSACCIEWGPDLSPGNVAWDRALRFERMKEFDATEKEFSHPKPDSDRAGAFFSMAFMAMAAAWSPDPEKPPFFLTLPVEKREGGRVAVAAVANAWSAHMLLPECARYRANLVRLRGLAFDVGKQEQFPSILAGARDLDRELTRASIQHEFEEYEGTHLSGIAARLETKVLPFFSRVLE